MNGNINDKEKAFLVRNRRVPSSEHVVVAPLAISNGGGVYILGYVERIYVLVRERSEMG